MANEKKPAEEEPLDLVSRFLTDLILWIVICGALSVALFLWDDNDSTGTWQHTITWFPAASIWTGIIGFNIAVADFIYQHAKHYGRNAVAWTTAFIVFSPFLAVIAYLLTWPKSEQQ